MSQRHGSLCLEVMADPAASLVCRDSSIVSDRQLEMEILAPTVQGTTQLTLAKMGTTVLLPGNFYIALFLTL